jgi:hypothetical protein
MRRQPRKSYFFLAWRWVVSRLVGMGTQWIGPDLRGPGGRQVFHQIHPGDPDAGDAVREMYRLHVVFVRMDQDAQGNIPERLMRAISSWRASILAHIKASLNRPGLPKEERRRRSRLLADMMGERVAYASLGFVAVLPVIFRKKTVYPLPGAVPPSRVVGHRVASLICVARDNGKIPKDKALAQEIASRIASGKIPLPPLIRVSEEDLPILIGKTDLGAPVIFPLGSATQASHLAIIGPTGRGKTVLAKRIVRQARERGVTPIILDTKGEMYERSGRSFLGLPIFSPTSKEAMWPAWSFPAAHKLWQEIIERVDRRNGEIQIARGTVAKVVDGSKDELTLSSQMLGQLVEFASIGWVSLNISEFASDLIGALKERLDWLNSLKASSHEEAIFSMSRHIALIGAKLLHQRLGQEAVPLLGENAPYRHLFFGSQKPSPLLKQGGIVTFQTLVGSVGDDLLKKFYTYVLQLIVSAIVAMRHAGTAPPRVLLYTEEAHRVSETLEQMVRITRAFGISVMIVTQGHKELTDGLLEQLRGVAVMGPSTQLLEGLFERLGVPYPADPFIRAGVHGKGVFLGRSKAVIDFPVPFTVELSPEERLAILGTELPKEGI